MTYLTPGKFALVAHRGGTIDGDKVLPENSIEAFENTLSIFPQAYFELDIRQTKDGEIIVMHDPTLDRTTNGKGLVSQLTLEEISQFQILAQGNTAPIPTLKQVLQRFPNSKISIEFKEPGYEKKTMDIILALGAQDRVVLASFSQKALNAARRLGPGICSGFANVEVPRMLMAVKSGLSLIAPRRGDVFQIPMEKNGVGVYSKSFLQLAHRLKKHVHVWTINEQSTMEKLILDGVDGIITDHPRLLFNVARRLGKI